MLRPLFLDSRFIGFIQGDPVFLRKALDSGRLYQHQLSVFQRGVGIGSSLIINRIEPVHAIAVVHGHHVEIVLDLAALGIQGIEIAAPGFISAVDLRHNVIRVVRGVHRFIIQRAYNGFFFRFSGRCRHFTGGHLFRSGYRFRSGRFSCRFLSVHKGRPVPAAAVSEEACAKQADHCQQNDHFFHCHVRFLRGNSFCPLRTIPCSRPAEKGLFVNIPPAAFTKPMLPRTGALLRSRSFLSGSSGSGRALTPPAPGACF